MHPINLWHQLHLHWRKISLIFLISTLGSHFSHAQKVFNLPNYDDKILHFGFYLALNSNAFEVTPSSYFVAKKDSIVSIAAPWAGGAMLGFIVSVRFNDYLDLRILPGVSFTERSLNYQFANNTKVSQKFEATYVEIPLMLKYKSKRRGNARMYVLGGGKMTISANTKKKDIKPDQVRLENMGFGVEYGFGFDIYNEMFKFAPEIRFSHGFSNMAIPDQYVFSKSLQSISLHTITLYFNFE
ncbi:MAG: hypothetical protein RL711_1837 [Bacteroidota bacterium]|jgi:hypothetical protein